MVDEVSYPSSLHYLRNSETAIMYLSNPKNTIYIIYFDHKKFARFQPIKVFQYP